VWDEQKSIFTRITSCLFPVNANYLQSLHLPVYDSTSITASRELRPAYMRPVCLRVEATGSATDQPNYMNQQMSLSKPWWREFSGWQQNFCFRGASPYIFNQNCLFLSVYYIGEQNSNWIELLPLGLSQTFCNVPNCTKVSSWDTMVSCHVHYFGISPQGCH
jgi:hypothetical protein